MDGRDTMDLIDLVKIKEMLLCPLSRYGPWCPYRPLSMMWLWAVGLKNGLNLTLSKKRFAKHEYRIE